jgi:hypothetical protein
MPGTPEASRVIGYAIATEVGFGVLRIIASPEAFEARAEELRLVALLLRFEGDTPPP